MSGTISPGAIDASIPLRAGQGVTPVQNPLDALGKFSAIQNALNTGQIQKQTIQSNQMSLAQQQKALAYAHILPAVLGGRINNMADLTSYAAGLEHYGINTQPFLADVAQTVTQGSNFVDNLKAQALAGVQPPEKAAGAVLPMRSERDVGGQIIPYLEGAPGMPGYGNPQQSGPGIERGYTPEQGLQQQSVPATTADVEEAARRGVTIVPGQMILKRTTTMVGPSVNPGGNRIPPGALGPGGYAPPQRPLDQLGKPYQPTTAPPPTPAATPPVPGAKLMRGPDGRPFWVPADKVDLATQNGFR